MMIQRFNTQGMGMDLLSRTDRAGRLPMVASRFPAFWRTPNDSFVWSPLIEMYQDKNKLTLRMEVPGINKDDIKISVVGNDLIIKGERKSESCQDGRDYMHCEMSYGSFYRSVGLPSEVRKDQIKATYDDGILEISMPRTPEKKNNPKNIKVARKAAKPARAVGARAARSRK